MTIEEIKDGEGGVVEVEGVKMAVYINGKTVTKLSPKCTHMGCLVKWNSAEKTWDCPCHGSKYKANGEVIKGPAKENLGRI